MQARLYYHSPFSEKSTYTQKDRALLLSFALKEVFTCTGETSQTWDNPLSSLKEKSYDAPLNKLQEHADLLLIAFPTLRSFIFELKEKISHLIYLLRHDLSLSPKDHLKEVFFLLEPLVKECNQDENLLFFLLSHNKEIDWLIDPSYLSDLFQEFYPGDLSKLQTLLCDHFHKKGFTGLVPEITSLLQQLKKRDLNEPSSC